MDALDFGPLVGLELRALGILPLVTEVCLARPGELSIAVHSQGMNTLPTPFLGFLPSKNRLLLYSWFLEGDLVTPKRKADLMTPRESWERVCFGRTYHRQT